MRKGEKDNGTKTERERVRERERERDWERDRADNKNHGQRPDALLVPNTFWNRRNKERGSTGWNTTARIATTINETRSFFATYKLKQWEFFFLKVSIF